MKMDIKEKQANVKSLWLGIKDFGSADYVKVDNISRLIMLIRGEIDSLNKKINKAEKQIEELTGK
jgi:hypothetical protein